jgi:general secretion pathway protein L
MRLLSRTSTAAGPGSSPSPTPGQTTGQTTGSTPGSAAGPILRLSKTAPPPGAVVTVPGSQIPLLRLDLPPGLRGQAREQVARRQLADRTGLSPDSLSLRPFLLQAPSGQKPTQKQVGKQWTQVLVGDTPYLQRLQALSCRAVLPDYLTLPTVAGLWTLALAQVPAADPTAEHDSPSAQPTSPLLMARLGPEDGFSAQPALALAMLRQALAAAPAERARPQAILWIKAAKADDPAQGEIQAQIQGEILAEIEALARAHDIALIHSAKAATTLGLPLPRVFAHGELACDLRHNPMAARAQLARAVLPWRWPLLAGCLAAGLWAAGELVQLSRLEAALTTQRAQNQALAKTHFIPDGPVLDARLQISRALSARRKGSAAAQDQADPLDLAARLAEVVSAADLRAELLSYRTGEGLVLALRLKDFAAADQLDAALHQAGLRSTLTESRVDEAKSGVQAEFVITGLAPPAPQPPQQAQPEIRPEIQPEVQQ